VRLELQGFLCAVDLIGPGNVHWVSVVERARIAQGVPEIREPDKLADLGWFAREALPTPLTQAAIAAVKALDG
jgi:8-oxo-dGTP diphosphatase